MALKGELDGEYFKTLGPTQLLAERGREILVINPGSAFLRIGLASQKEPLLIPHCIARYAPELARKRQKVRGGINEVDEALVDRRKSSLEAGTSQEKEEACQQIEAHLNITPGWLQTASAKELSRLNLVPEGEDTGFQWTETSTALPPIAKLEVDPLRGSDSQAEVAQKVKEESQSYVAPTDRPSQDETVRIEEGVVKTGAESDFAEQGTDGPRDVGADDQPKEGDGDRQEPVDSQEGKKEGLSSDLNGLRSEGHEINAVQKGDNVSEGPKTKHRRWICGEEALNIAHCDPYVLRRPIRRGRLNVSKSYPLQQVCTDLCAIWQWAITDKLGLRLADVRSMSALVVLAETLQPREAKELLTVIFRHLGFESAILHQESLAALFGNNMTSACIVSLGAQVCSVACVEEGTVLPSSRIALPFGGEDISRALLWIQQHYVHAWPYGACDPLSDVQDRLLLESLKEEHCFFGEGGHVEPSVQFTVREKGASTEHYEMSLVGSPNLAPVGLFHPRLLASEEYPLPNESALSEDYEELLDDAGLAEPSRRASELTGDPLYSFQQFAPGPAGASMIGVDIAIVRSILSTYSPELQKKLFSSIQLIGGGALIPGVVDFVEERVLHTIPGHIDADTVEVVKNRGDPRTLAWRGGCILAVLDYSEAWIQREDWMDGGVRPGTGRKYKDTNNLSTQTFWYSSMAE